MIQIKADGTRLFQRIDLGIGALQDLSPAFEEVDKIFRKMERAHFSSQGSRSGQAWAQLSERYKAAKARRFGGKPILRRTDRLYNSLVNEGGEHIKNISKMRGEYGTRVPYGIHHYFGTGTMPARPPIPEVTSEDMAMIAEVFLGHVLKPMKRG